MPDLKLSQVTPTTTTTPTQLNLILPSSTHTTNTTTTAATQPYNHDKPATASPVAHPPPHDDAPHQLHHRPPSNPCAPPLPQPAPPKRLPDPPHTSLSTDATPPHDIMPSSLAAESPSERPSERRAREKRDRDPNKPKKPRSSKPRPIDPETGLPVRRRKKEKEEKKEGEMNAESEPSVSMADLVPELSRTASAPGASRESLPYPSLSKAHSKDAVYSRVDLNNPDVYTPEPTDIEAHKARGSQESLKGKSPRGSQESLKGKSPRGSQESLKREGPPTPPDTELSAQRKSSTSTPARAAKIREEEARGSRSSSRGSERSWFGRPKVVKDDRSRVSTKSKESRGTARKSSRPRVDVVEVVEDEYLSDEGQSRSGFDSNATSIAPKRTQPQQVAAGSGGRPPGLDTDSGQSNRESASPRTPTATPKFDAHDPKNFARDFRPTPSPFVSFDVPGGQQQQQSNFDSPLPPPPPP
ncbi:hypothetical protein V500_03246, partial [Pseudogymnoascus sp. VKM F-4518 (FW-2643)]